MRACAANPRLASAERPTFSQLDMRGRRLADRHDAERQWRPDRVPRRDRLAVAAQSASPALMNRPVRPGAVHNPDSGRAVPVRWGISPPRSAPAGPAAARAMPPGGAHRRCSISTLTRASIWGTSGKRLIRSRLGYTGAQQYGTGGRTRGDGESMTRDDSDLPAPRRVAAGIDIERVTGWFAEHIPAAAPPCGSI